MSDPTQPVREELARVLDCSTDALHDTTRLVDAGLDSAGAVTLAARLSERLGRVAPAWLAWQHPTVGALVRGLAGLAQGAGR